MRIFFDSNFINKLLFKDIFLITKFFTTKIDFVFTNQSVIKNKQYFDSLKDYYGEIIFVGFNYDEKDKTHKCKIARFVKEK